MSKGLTKKQKEILDFITEFIDQEGFAPSYREIADNFGLSSVATVHAHIQALQERGYLRASEGEARAIELVDQAAGESATVQELPLVGLIAAGEPIEANDSKESLEVPQSMLGSGDYYALQVKGESMIEDGIHDGDFVVVERRDVANNGDVVVALLKGREATLKRFYKEAKRVRLEPANSSMEPIFVTGDLEIQGRVVGLMRKF